MSNSNIIPFSRNTSIKLSREESEFARDYQKLTVEQKQLLNELLKNLVKLNATLQCQR